MYSYIIEELARAIATEREEEARRRRLHSEQRPVTRLPLRLCRARTRVAAGSQLDQTAGEQALKATTGSDG